MTYEYFANVFPVATNIPVYMRETYDDENFGGSLRQFITVASRFRFSVQSIAHSNAWIG